MSEKEIQRIKCPKCGSEHDFEIWTRVNTDLDPVLKDKVRNGQLFRTVCPSCGQQIDVVYPCLYHEMENKVMIYYAPGAKAMKDAAAAFDEGSEETVKERGFGIYVLSNASDLFYKYFPNLLPLDFFDGVFVSSDYLMLKPDLEIYETFLTKYGLKAEECLFVDDRQENADGAAKTGMNTF